MNFNSPEWHEVETLLDERLAELDLENRNPQLDWNSTLGIRGEMQALNWLKQWPVRVEALTHHEEQFSGIEQE